jgi:CrcB protein
MRNYLLVGIGGAFGAMVRYTMNGWLKGVAGSFPLDTFLINLSGSFILGLFLTLLTRRNSTQVELRLLVGTGFIGAYTTFSSFTNEVLTLLRSENWLIGLSYSLASLVGGMLCVWAGYLGAVMLEGGLKKTKAVEQPTEEEQPIPEGKK